MVRPTADSTIGRCCRGRSRASLCIAASLTTLAVAVVAALSSPAAAGPSLQPSASVSLTKTVYASTDGGSQCGSALGYAEAEQDDLVTYCFTVTNTGVTDLASIVITDQHVTTPPILISADSTPLAPAHSARYYVESTPPPDAADGVLDETYTNVATVSASPTDDAGNVLGDQVSASGEAVVYPAEDIPLPQVKLTTEVYAGTDAGVGCPASESVAVNPGDPVTYCFRVANIGNTHLDSIEITDPIFGFAENAGAAPPVLVRADSQPVAPGDSAYYYLDSVTPTLPSGGLLTTSAVTANSVGPDGSDLTGLADVFDNDAARLELGGPETLTPAQAPATPTPDPAPAEPAPVTPSPTAAAPEEPGPAAPSPAAEAATPTPNPESAAVPTPSVEAGFGDDPAPTPAAKPTANSVGGLASASAPDQLAYTGWETPLLLSLGLGLLAGGRSLMRSAEAEARLQRRRRSPQPSGGSES